MKRSQWFLLIVFGLAVAIVAAYLVGSSSTEQRRSAARAALDEHVEEARAGVEARRAALHTSDQPSDGAPLSKDEMAAFHSAIEAAWNSGWDKLSEEISNTEGPWPPELVAKVREWLGAHADLLAQALAVAQRGADVEIADYSQKVIQDEISRITGLRSAARLLLLDAEVKAADGQYDAAVDRVLDALSIGDLMGSQPLIITQMTRIATYHSALDEVDSLLDRHELTDAQLDELNRALENAYQRDVFAAAMANEAQLGVTVFDGMRDSFLGGVLRPFVNMNEASYIEGMTALSEVAGEQYYEGAPRSSAVQRTSQDLPFTHYVSRTLLRVTQPALVRAIETQARCEADIDMARIAIALERAYQANGAYPETLSSISPYLNGEFPIDPFSGEPYHYRLENGGFTLYSVGSDVMDDGGVAGRRGGDIVWGREPDQTQAEDPRG